MALLRTCLGCGQEDDHPRHDTVLPDGSHISFHFDCHSRTGQGCAACAAVVASAAGLQGDELRAHVVEHDPAAPVAARLNHQAAVDAGQITSEA